ncbi:MAG TPA: hypothetical protein PK655_01370 [archaeon]|nr:hypothetical protein [archaeon]HPV66083.1 hypothetical protein [archaeon]HRS42279.1 hypothetical protein [Candidatus Diapherotrites archaeon]
MNRKGQLSIEIIVLLAIFLLFFQAMILPSIEFSENVLQDTQAIVVSKKNIEDLAINIEQLASQDGYGKKQYYFYLPRNTKLDCNVAAKKLNYNITISKQQPLPPGCNNSVCEFQRELFLQSQQFVDCNKIGPGFSGILMIEKKADGNITLISE